MITPTLPAHRSMRSIGKPPASYPGSIATDQHLAIAVDRQATVLALPLNSADTSMTVRDAGQIIQWSLLSIDDEVVQVTGAPSGNVVTISRGFDGTAAAIHLAGANVFGLVDAYHHNTLVSEVQAIEQALGTNLSRIPAVPFLVSSNYDFAAQSPGGSLVVGNNSITLTPVPLGVNGGDANHYLYVSGGIGTAEAVLITGGSATSGAPSGTLIIQCANTHSGAWTIKSATAGIQEAVVALPGGSGRIYVPAGSRQLWAPVRVAGAGVHITGAGAQATNLEFAAHDGSNCFEFVAPTTGPLNSIRDLAIFGPGSTVPTLKTGGAALLLQKQSYFWAQNLFIWAIPDGIRAIASGYVVRDIYIREMKPTTGIAVYNDGADGFDTIIDHVCCDASSAYRAGIEIVNAGYIAIDRCDLVQANFGLLIDPGNGGFVNTVDVIGSYFDTAAIYGVYIAPSGNGMVTRCRFVDCWMASAAQHGVYILATSPAIVDGISFISCYAPFNNAMGFLIDGTATRNVAILRCFVYGNNKGNPGSSNGISIGGGVIGVAIQDTVSGQYGDATNTQGRGLQLFPGATDYVTVIGNDFSRNTIGPLLDQATGVHKIIANNSGIDDTAPLSIASAATIALPSISAPMYQITGTTAVTAITGGWIGRTLTLFKTDAGSVTILGKTLAQNATVSFRCIDGTLWL